MGGERYEPAGDPSLESPTTDISFSLGIRFGDGVFTSGSVGRDAEGKMAEDIRGQTRNALENIRAVLEASGSGMEHVLKTTVYLTDIREFEAMNEVYKSFFSVDPPARTTVGVAALGKPEMRVEIEVVAAIQPAAQGD